MTLRIETRNIGRATVIAIAGDEPVFSDEGVRRKMMQALEKSKYVIIDIAGLESFDWEDLGLLLRARHAHRDRWGTHMHLFKIVVRAGKHRVMIESMHMEHILATYRSLPEALATIPRRRAMLLEPETELASVIEILLEANGFEVLRFAGPEEAPARSVIGDLDIVVTELTFKGRVDPDHVRQLRLEYGVPVGVVAANAPDEADGAAFVLSKPVVPGNLLGEIIRALEQPLHQYYQSIFDALPLPICVVSTDGQLQSVNSAWSRQFRVDPQREHEAGFQRAFPDNDAHLPEIMERILGVGQGHDVADLVLSGNDGAPPDHPIKLRFSRLQNVDAEPHVIMTALNAAYPSEPVLENPMGDANVWSAMLSLLEDLDAARAEIAGAHESLQGLDRMKSEFISTVSHELRTPVAAIMGSAENLLDGFLGEVEPRQKRTLEIVLRNGRRLSRLIDNLLDLSRLESGSFRIHKRRSDLREMIRMAVEEVLPIAERSGATVRWESPGEAVPVDVDPDRIAQVMINLLDNALRFARGKVRVALESRGRDVVITVEDNGSGVSEEHLPHLFDRFSRVRSSSGLSQTGLGLSIVKGIVEEHRGKVWAENRREESGARFLVLLPLPSPDEGVRPFPEDEVRGRPAVGDA